MTWVVVSLGLLAGLGLLGWFVVRLAQAEFEGLSEQARQNKMLGLPDDHSPGAPSWWNSL